MSSWNYRMNVQSRQKQYKMKKDGGSDMFAELFKNLRAEKVDL